MVNENIDIEDVRKILREVLIEENIPNLLMRGLNAHTLMLRPINKRLGLNEKKR